MHSKQVLSDVGNPPGRDVARISAFRLHKLCKIVHSVLLLMPLAMEIITVHLIFPLNFVW